MSITLQAALHYVLDHETVFKLWTSMAGSPADLVKGMHVMHSALSLCSACSTFQTHLTTLKQIMC